MPNRFIKESICTSDSLDGLSWFEEVFFYRLIVNCDDFGRFDARPSVLKARLFPLKDRMTLKDVSSALRKLADMGIVRLYECDSKPYLYFPTWEVHQTKRANKSKFPSPDDSLKTSENICKQEKTDSPVFGFDIRDSGFDIRDSGFDIRDSDSSDSGAPKIGAPPVMMFPLIDKTEFAITEDMVKQWTELFPAVDVMQEVRNMRAWLDANPKNRKTRNGVMKFATGWLTREQNRARPRSQQAKRKSFAELAAEMDAEEGKL